MALLSGEMQVEQRAAVIDRFRDGKEKVLVTTNVCARGETGGGRRANGSPRSCLYPILDADWPIHVLRLH